MPWCRWRSSRTTCANRITAMLAGSEESAIFGSGCCEAWLCMGLLLIAARVLWWLGLFLLEPGRGRRCKRETESGRLFSKLFSSLDSSSSTSSSSSSSSWAGRISFQVVPPLGCIRTSSSSLSTDFEIRSGFGCFVFIVALSSSINLPASSSSA